MTLRNEIFEGLAAAKASSDLVKGFRGNPLDDYYREKAEEARRRNEQNREVDRNRKAAEAGAPRQLSVRPPRMASTLSPGPALASTQALNTDYQLPGTYRRGGRVKKYQAGGSVQDDLTKMPTAETYAPPPAAINTGPPRSPNDPGGSADGAVGDNSGGVGEAGTVGAAVGTAIGEAAATASAVSADNSAAATGEGADSAMARGGRVRRRPPARAQYFDEGGSVAADSASSDYEAESDRIITEMIERQVGLPEEGPDVSKYYNAPGELSRSMPVPDEDTDQPRDWQAHAAPRRREMDRATNQQLPQPPGAPTTVPGGLDKPRSKLGDVKRKIIGDSGEGVYAQPNVRTERGFDEQWKRNILEQLNRANPRPHERLTDEQREQRMAEVARLRAELAAGSPSERIKQRAQAFDASAPPRPAPPDRTAPPTPPAPPTMGTATAAQAPQAAPPTAQPAPATPPATAAPAGPAGPTAPAGGVSPEQIPPRAGGNPLLPNFSEGVNTGPPPLAGRRPVAPSMLDPSAGGNWGRAAPVTPEVAAATAPPTPAPTTPNGPATSGNSGPSGTTASPAPPITASGSRPTQALNDPTRIAAFNPETERGIGAVDPSGRAINTGAPPMASGPPQQLGVPSSGMTGGQADQGMSTNNVERDVTRMLTGALSASGVQPGGPPPFVGHNASSRPVLQRVVQAYNQGGQLSPGTAMLRGMMSMYQTLLSQGRVDEANKMAYGLVQAANLEMAAYGSMALDQLKHGDSQGALRTVIEGVDYAPDGLTHRLSADGRMIESVNTKGAVASRTPVDGRWVLAAATGLRDGTALWQTLQGSAAQLNKDRNPEGRMLQNELRRRQIENMELRNRKLSQPAAGVPSGVHPDAERILRGTQAPSAP